MLAIKCMFIALKTSIYSYIIATQCAVQLIDQYAIVIVTAGVFNLANG